MAQKFCTKCGHELKSGQKFCTFCGEKVHNPTKPNPNELTPEEKEKVNNIRKTLNVVFLCVISFVSLLFIIAPFLPIAASGGKSVYGKIDFIYLINDAPANLKNIYNLLPYKEYYGFQVVIYVLQCVFFFGGLIGTYLCVILGLIKNIKRFAAKKDIDLKIFFTAGALQLPSIMLNAIVYFKSDNYNMIGFGAGSILVMVGLAFIIICSFAKIAFSYYERKHLMKSVIANGVSAIMLFIAFFISFSPLTTNFNGYDFYSENGGMYAMFTALQQYSSSQYAEFDASYFVPGLFVIILSVLSMVFLIIVIKQMLKDDSTLTVTFSVIALLLLVGAAALSCHLLGAQGMFYIGTIIGIAFIAFAIIGMMIAKSLGKRRRHADY